MMRHAILLATLILGFGIPIATAGLAFGWPIAIAAAKVCGLLVSIAVGALLVMTGILYHSDPATRLL